MKLSNLLILLLQNLLAFGHMLTFLISIDSVSTTTTDLLLFAAYSTYSGVNAERVREGSRECPLGVRLAVVALSDGSNQTS